MKERGKASAFSALAAACFSSAAVLHDVAVNATTVGVFLGTMSILAAAFFAGRKEVK